MVITRSQSSQNRQVETENMDRSSDNESEASFPELLSRDQMVDLDSDDVLTRRQNSNSYSIDQRFNEINRQIGDLTNIVLTLTNQFASVNGEGNRLNPATTSTDGRSDNRFHAICICRDFWKILVDPKDPRMFQKWQKVQFFFQF